MRARARGGEAVVDLGGLLGDVDVDRAGVALQSRAQRVDRRRRRGAQRMDRHAGLHVRQRPARARRRAAPAPLDTSVAKRRWSGRSCGCVKPARSYSTGSSVRPMPVGRGGVGQRAAHGQRVGVGAALGVVVQVVELADLRIAAAQQLRIQLRRHGAQLCRRDAQRHAVHAVAPGPEVVVLAAAAFGQAGEGALEGVAVRVDQAGQHRAGQHGGLRRRGRAGVDLGPVAVGIGAQQHGVVPAPVDPGARCPQQRSCGHGCQSSIVCTSRRSSGVTSAARSSCQR